MWSTNRAVWVKGRVVEPPPRPGKRGPRQLRLPRAMSPAGSHAAVWGVACALIDSSVNGQVNVGPSINRRARFSGLKDSPHGLPDLKVWAQRPALGAGPSLGSRRGTRVCGASPNSPTGAAPKVTLERLFPEGSHRSYSRNSTKAEAAGGFERDEGLRFEQAPFATIMQPGSGAGCSNSSN